MHCHGLAALVGSTWSLCPFVMFCCVSAPILVPLYVYMFGFVCLCVSGWLVNKCHQARKSYCVEASPHQLLLISIGSDLLLNCVAVL